MVPSAFSVLSRFPETGRFQDTWQGFYGALVREPAMGYEEETAERVRRAISRKYNLAEIKMFGGLCFMVNGNMCCGISDKALMIRASVPRRTNGHSPSRTRVR